MSGETSASGSPPRGLASDREAALARAARRSLGAHRARPRASGGASAAQPREEARRPPPASPSTSSSTPRSSLSTKPARPSSRARRYTNGPEADALHGALDARPHAPRRGAPRHRSTSSRSTWYALACASWMRGMCSRARDDDVVGEPLGGDPPAVVADERDRRQPAPARLGQRRDHVAPSCRSSRARAARRPAAP